MATTLKIAGSKLFGSLLFLCQNRDIKKFEKKILLD